MSQGEKKTAPVSSRPAMVFALAVPLVMAAILIIPASREVFMRWTALQPYLMGFAKFALLATTGEVIAAKVAAGAFTFPRGAVVKAAIWGLIGMMMALMMPVFSGGVAAAQAGGFLPGASVKFLTALFTSVIMNLTFGLAMMAFHRVTDTVVDRRVRKEGKGALAAVKAIDWSAFVGFVVFKAIPFFWIPAHTITFLLPGEYRVFVSAVLSIVLGLLQAIAKRKSN